MKRSVPGPADPLYRFGSFVVDPVVGRLCQGETEVHLPRKTFQVLEMLLERPGEVVEKDEVFRAVWPDVFVEENNLVRHVSILRKALHEHEPSVEHIITVAGRGYRFAPQVSTFTREALGYRTYQPPLGPAEDATAFPSDPGRKLAEPVGRRSAASRSLGRPGARMALAAAIAFITVAGVTAPRWLNSLREAQPARALWQLTTSGQFDSDPSWSPDGQRVAFASDRRGNMDIWIQPTDEGTPIQVTFDEAADVQPAWSPDGRFLIFRSERNGGGLFVVPALGGTERQLTDFGDRPRWSPDGSLVLFSSSDSAGCKLNLMTPHGGDSRLWRSDIVSGLRDCYASWHPDGRRISIHGNHVDRGWTFWTAPIDGGPAVRSDIALEVSDRLQLSEVRLLDFTWSAGGDTLYFAGQSGQSRNLWRVSVAPDTLRWVSGPERLTTGSSSERALALSPDGRRLAFASHVERTRAWSLPFDPDRGKVTGAGEPITPGGSDTVVIDVSSDGKQFAYGTARRGRQELWVASTDGHTDRLAAVQNTGLILQPRWSDDGAKLAYLRVDQADRLRTLMLLSFSPGEEHQSLSGSIVTNVYDWTPDGSGVLVGCRGDSGRIGICVHVASTSGRPTTELRLLASDPRRNLFAAQVSPDGRSMAFLASADGTTVYVAPLGGDRWTAVTDGTGREDKPRWSPDGRTLFYLARRNGAWNLWGRRIDLKTGSPTGEPFQVTSLTSPARMIKDHSQLQLSITRDRLVLPITETSGSIWVLDSVDR